MPALLVFTLSGHPSPDFDTRDVVDVLPHTQHPGDVVVAEPWRYGFVYVTDAEPADLKPTLLEPLLSETEDEYEPGVFPVIARRRYAVGAAMVPDETAVREYRAYADELAVKVTRAALEAALTDKVG